MIKRELYMAKIRPFMEQNIIKVLTGIRRCGKSVMLELIKDELKEMGFSNEEINSYKKISLYDEILLNPDLEKVE